MRHAAPTVLSTEWLVGATTIPTLKFARAFGRVHDIYIGALLDEQDEGGSAVAMVLERLTGLDGNPATSARLYFPYQLLEPAAYFARFERIGGKILELERT